MRKKITIGIIVVAISLLGAFLLKNKQERIEYNSKTREFNINLIKKVNSKIVNKNYLISPYSIYNALGMLRDGAKGDTKTQIEDLIGNYKITKLNMPNMLSVANALLIKNSYKHQTKNTYIDLLQKNYNAEVVFDEFRTPKVINGWVNKKTNGMINGILDNISKDFVLGLINAISLDVKWENSFNCEDTNSMLFNKVDGSKINVEMMHRNYMAQKHYYFNTDNAKGIILPYESDGYNNLEFIGIIPNDSVVNYINNLNNEEIEKIDNLKKEAVKDLYLSVYLPRFTNNFKLENFIDILKELGVTNAFNGSLADFTNIMEDEKIYVSEAIHNTYINLNENGTKAAATTYFGMTKATAASTSSPDNKVEIKFDKPFIYLIRDAKTKEIVFFGTMYEPNVWSGTTCKGEN